MPNSEHITVRKQWKVAWLKSIKDCSTRLGDILKSIFFGNIMKSIFYIVIIVSLTSGKTIEGKHKNMCKELQDDVTVIANDEPVVNSESEFGINNHVYVTIKSSVKRNDISDKDITIYTKARKKSQYKMDNSFRCSMQELEMQAMKAFIYHGYDLILQQENIKEDQQMVIKHNNEVVFNARTGLGEEFEEKDCRDNFVNGNENAGKSGIYYKCEVMLQTSRKKNVDTSFGKSSTLKISTIGISNYWLKLGIANIRVELEYQMKLIDEVRVGEL